MNIVRRVEKLEEMTDPASTKVCVLLPSHIGEQRERMRRQAMAKGQMIIEVAFVTPEPTGRWARYSEMAVDIAARRKH